MAAPNGMQAVGGLAEMTVTVISGASGGAGGDGSAKWYAGGWGAGGDDRHMALAAPSGIMRYGEFV